MQIHHTKHHAAYVANFNIATAKLAEAQHKGDISSMISLQQAVKFNGGGHVNHSIFWKNLAPICAGGGELPPGDLRTLIEAQYGSLENLQTVMTATTVGVQGSGWGTFLSSFLKLRRHFILLSSILKCHYCWTHLFHRMVGLR